MIGSAFGARVRSAALRATRTVRHHLQRTTDRIGYASRGDDGFTLLEVVVSFVLFAIIAASATAAIANSITVSNTTNDRVAATNLAQKAIAKARADHATLESSPNTTSTTGNYIIAQTATIPTSGSTICPVGSTIPFTVTVSWKKGSATRSVRMDTVIAC